MFISQMNAAQQATHYADRLDQMASLAERARASIAPSDLHVLATEIRASAKMLPATGVPEMAAASDGSVASPYLMRDLQAAGMSVRKHSVDSFDAEARSKNLPTETRIRLKTMLMRENLLVA
jgi:hypothetical protein